MSSNVSSIKTSSDGVWQGENPLHYAFPLLIIQTILVIITSRTVAFFLKPFRQPIVVAEIVGGIILGPSALGRNKEFMGWVFSPWSTPILESVASIGLLFFLFLVGLELDLNSIRRSGKKAFSIAIAGISLPFLFGIGLTFLLRKAQSSPAATGFGPNFMFIGISLSITAFPVLARILAELKLLTTGVGQTAMAAAAVNDVFAWILLALAISLAGSGGKGTAMTSIWILLSCLGFVAFMILVIRPVMSYLVRKCSSQNDAVESSFVILILAGVMLSGFMTDMIGIHSIFGAFMFGIIIPKDGEFAGKLIKRIEDFVTGLLLPLYFASTGLKTDISKISGGSAWGLVAVVISTACAGKILGTFMMAMMCTIPVRESLALGVLMNTKGLVELIVLNIGRQKKVLDEKMFTILVMMALFTTFITTPIVVAIYKPSHSLSSETKHSNTTSSKKPTSNPRILACLREPRGLPLLISLVDSYGPAAKVYVMRLVELTERPSSIVMVQRSRKNGLPCIARFYQGDEFNEQVGVAFHTYHKRGAPIRIRPTTSISKLSIMHMDICLTAEKKQADLIILPFHKEWKREDDHAAMEIDLGQDWRGVNERVLANATCSVAVLVDRGLGLRLGAGPGNGHFDGAKRVCVAYYGGPDSRGALELGGRMAEHPDTRVTVVRFWYASKGVKREVKSNLASSSSQLKREDQEDDQDDDEATLIEFKQKFNGVVNFIEKRATNIAKEMLSIAQSKEFELIVVGKGRFPRAIEHEVGNHHVEYDELGPIGGLLASSGHGINGSILVIQQHDPAHRGRGHGLKGLGERMVCFMNA